VTLKPPAEPLPTPLPAGAPLRPGRLPRLSAPLVIAEPLRLPDPNEVEPADTDGVDDADGELSTRGRAGR